MFLDLPNFLFSLAQGLVTFEMVAVPSVGVPRLPR